MKINEPSRVGNVNPYRKQQDARQLAGAGKKEKPKDEVQISAEAKELQETQGAANPQEAELRRKKLADLKQAVSTGTYHVDAGKIAEKLFPYLK